jgi:hypothetical protein
MNFTISNLESNADGGVIVAHWQVSKTSGELVASSYGTVSLTPDPESEDYIAYDSLTEDDVIGWVQEELDTEALEAGLDADLAEQASPSVIVGVPW